MINLIKELIKKDNITIDNSILPTKGYFYPKNFVIEINRGDINDQILFNKVAKNPNTNFVGIILTIKKILSKRIKIYKKGKYLNDYYDIENIIAIDLIYIFLEFIKHTKKAKIYFDGIEFNSDNFLYFDFDDVSEYYNENGRYFEINGWKFTMPKLKTQTSINDYLFNLYTKKGQTNEINLNFIYFIKDIDKLDNKKIEMLIDIYNSLPPHMDNELASVIERFKAIEVYFLVSYDKNIVHLTLDMIRNCWS